MRWQDLKFADLEDTLKTRSGTTAAVILEASVFVRSDPPATYPVPSIYVPFPQSERDCLRYFGE